jgi:hypothetical protein
MVLSARTQIKKSTLRIKINAVVSLRPLVTFRI